MVGELSKQPPWVCTAAHVVFEGGICSVSIMLKHGMPVTWELHYNGHVAGGDPHATPQAP